MESIVLFCSYILLLWYVGYDDIISMNNGFVFVLTILTFLRVLLLCLDGDEYFWEIPLSNMSKFLYLSSFFYFFILYLLCIHISDNILFSIFLSSGVFIFSQTLTLYFFLSFYLSFTLSVCSIFYLWFIIIFFCSVVLSVIFFLVKFDIIYDNMLFMH